MTVVVIGGGPAGLMAAEEMARAGLSVVVADAKPSLGRKFLMAGKSGLNLTKDEPFVPFLASYPAGAEALRPMLEAFGPGEVMRWAEGLGQELFTGSTGRVFPRVMKASPLLRAWLARLDDLGVKIRTRWCWTGWQGDALCFDTPGGVQQIMPDATVLALGGGSWARLGSDGAWAALLAARGVALAPFQPSNVGIAMAWSQHMRPHFGQPLKAVRWHVVPGDGAADPAISRGEAILSARGLEGGGVYPLVPALRAGGRLVLDLAPDMDADRLAARLSGVARQGLGRSLRNGLRWPPHKRALFHECTAGQEVPRAPAALAALIKALPVRHAGLGPLDEAISTAGGVPFAALDEALMLRDLPGIHCVGEMLDWDAPTGGYLLTACLATGRWAGRAIASRR